MVRRYAAQINTRPPRYNLKKPGPYSAGMLVKAMRSGDWVVLDSVNLCNPTVLDRLNPLLETNGESSAQAQTPDPSEFLLGWLYRLHSPNCSFPDLKPKPSIPAL